MIFNDEIIIIIHTNVYIYIYNSKCRINRNHRYKVELVWINIRTWGTSSKLCRYVNKILFQQLYIFEIVSYGDLV